MDKLELLKKRIAKFNKDRDWDQFHTPSNLAKSISIEANELLECFQWNDTEFDIEEVKDELADVMNYCIQMSQVLSIDLIEIIRNKYDLHIFPPVLFIISFYSSCIKIPYTNQSIGYFSFIFFSFKTECLSNIAYSGISSVPDRSVKFLLQQQTDFLLYLQLLQL